MPAPAALPTALPTTLSNANPLAELASLAACIAKDPTDAGPWCRIGFVYLRLGELDEALASFTAAAQLQPGLAEAAFGAAIVEHTLGNTAAALPLIDAAIAAQADEQRYWSARAHLLAASGASAPQVSAAYADWARRFADPLPPLPPQPLPAPVPPGRRLRIAYVSADLRDHALRYFIEPVLRHHDRQHFELHAFASGRSDATTAQLKPLFDHWHDLGGLDDHAAAERIAAAGIDIAVDLSGHTDGTRLLSLARRPAPVQFTWFGYNCTTGMSQLDGRLTDAVMDPPGSEAHAREPLVRLPVFACYQPPEDAPPEISPLPLLARGGVTFGSLNNAQKLSSHTLACWGQLLRRVPGSRLLLIGPFGPTAPASTRQAFAARLQHAGVPAGRLLLLPRQTREDFFRLSEQIDIALEPWPFSGGVTTCHALWMGLPCITLAGSMPYERAAAAILSAAGLDELIATSPDAYLSLATRLACDVVRLAELRQGLRERLRHSRLMAYRQQVDALEACFSAAHAASIAGSGSAR